MAPRTRGAHVNDEAQRTYVATRRQLRGVAEALIAGPQYRATGTIRLAVRPDGFVGGALPLGVHGVEGCTRSRTGCPQTR